MQIQADVLAKALKAVLFAASKDLERLPLCAVQIWTEGDRLNLGATDGHWALWWQDVLDQSLPTERIGIPRGDAELLLHALNSLAPDDPECEWPTVTMHLDPAEVIADKFTIRMDLVDLTPQLTEIWRMRTSGQLPWVGVTARFVTSAAKAFCAAAGLKDNVRVSLSFGATELDPILVTCEACEQLTAIIMPAKETPTELRQEVRGEDVLWIRKDTGEVVKVVPRERQVDVPGTEDPVGKAASALGDVAASMGGTVSVEINGEKVVLTAPEKKERKARKKAEEVSV